MSNFERALTSYRNSTRHCASIGEDARSVHSRRKALLRSGKVYQAAAIRRARKKVGIEDN